jgi:hypothetical protein
MELLPPASSIWAVAALTTGFAAFPAAIFVEDIEP